jgi:hypothetical protein
MLELICDLFSFSFLSVFFINDTISCQANLAQVVGNEHRALVV